MTNQVMYVVVRSTEEESEPWMLFDNHEAAREYVKHWKQKRGVYYQIYPLAVTRN